MRHLCAHEPAVEPRARGERTEDGDLQVGGGGDEMTIDVEVEKLVVALVE